MTIDFVNLHNHTHFSILDSLIAPKDLFLRAKELGQPAVAVTDHGTFSGVWDALKASKETGVKLIVGCEFYFANDTNNKEEKFRHVILLAKNAIGYKNILTLNRRGFDNYTLFAKRIYSIIDWNLLKQYSEGVICLTSCGNGIIGQLLTNDKFDEAEDATLKLKSIFGDDLGLEIQANNMSRGSNLYNDKVEQNFINRYIIKLAQKHNIKIVPTTNSHYLKKEDYDTHDVLLSIGSHQPIYSNFRLKYPVPDFYLKSGEEVHAFFHRLFPESIDEWCANTVYFANKCEFPDWIDPKYSNPSGKELPEFPVKTENDYSDFMAWSINQPDDVKSLEEDKQYLRYKCQLVFDSKVPLDKYEEYKSRLLEELDVIEHHGFSSYMLIVADYITWARKNKISVGEGRGCLTGDTKVLTINGFSSLDSIKINDIVFSHTGKKQKVLNTFKFDVSKEKILKIKTNHSFNDISLTKNHKLFATKAVESQQYIRLLKNNSKSINSVRRYESFKSPQWIKAQDLKVNDLIYTTFPIRNNLSLELPKHFNIKFSSTSNSHLDKECNIEVDNDFMYLLGRFVGDGWIRYPDKMKKYDGYALGIAFNSNDVESINKFSNYFSNLGLKVCKYKHTKKNLIQLLVHNKSLVNILRDFFPDYKNTSNTKHLPYFFRQLNEEQLKFIILGVIDSDGFKKEKSRAGNIVNRISIDSTSYRLICELKELLLYLKTKSSINTRKEFLRGKYKCKKSYKLRFSKKDFYNTSELAGYYSKILKIEETTNNYVYDITVNEDHSYLTSNYVVHNSVGGSLIAYLLDIHRADPIKYNLIFARFHNKEKSSFPDIDTDFAPSGREKVQNYIRNKYGEDHVAHVSNVNTITPKVYVRDICRSCELGGSKDAAVKLGNDIADCIPARDIHSINDALQKLPLFSEYVKKYPELAKYSEISGKYRAWSTHAGGLIISKRPLTGLIPIRKDKDGVIAIEYDKERAEENGLIKMDTLGLSTLDIIDKTYNLIEMAGKVLPPDPLNYDEYDKKTYDLISKGDTFCVFQLGTSTGTIELCKQIKAKSIEDISHINALARPSAKDIRTEFIKTRENKQPVSLLHPSLQRAFGNTLGFGLYEESLMYLAQDVAGWSLHAADRLRKLTKEKGKNPKKAQQWRAEFITDAVNNNINEEIAKKIWDEVVDKFQGYGFNLSHSILYSMISYKTAYLKAHYPIEFLLANLMSEVNSNSPDAAKNIAKIKQELRNRKVKILSPDINKSQLTYSLIEENVLITGLDALKFVSEDAINDIISKRPFTSFFDFMAKVDSGKVRSNTIQALISSGCLDSFNISRKLMFLYCSDYRKKLTNWLSRHDPKTEEFIYPWVEEKEWNKPELYALEKFYLGESFICSTLEAYGDFFKETESTVDKVKEEECITINEVKKMDDRQKISSMKVVVRSFFEFKVKKVGSKYLGMSMIKADVEDLNGSRCTLTIFPDRWQQVNDRFREFYGKNYSFDEGVGLHFSGNTNVYEEEIGVVLNQLFKCVPAPQVPKDLKAKKISLKETRSKIDKQISQRDITPEQMFEEVEASLFEAGLIDLDEEIDDDDN